MKIFTKVLIFSLMLAGISQLSLAEVVVDTDGRGHHLVHVDNFKTREDAFASCAVFDSIYHVPPESPGGCGIMGIAGSAGLMVFDGWYLNNLTNVFDVANYYINKCPAPSVYNVATAECGHDLQKGAPPLNSCVADPINVAVGNSFQSESDFSLNGSVIGFTRYYNSLDGFWRHSYSTHLNMASGTLSVVRADGQELFYSFDSTDVTPLSGQSEILTHSKDGTWRFVDTTNAIFSFDAIGKLVKQVDPAGRVLFLSRAGNITTVTDASGNQLTFTEDANFQPKTFGVKGIVGSYSYDNNGHLVDALVQGAIL